MSLINNGVRDGGGPGWRYGSNQHATAERGKWGADNGTRNNFHYGDATQVAGVSISDKYGAPSGYRHPVSWCMGIKPGAIASYKRATISLEAAASGAEGLGFSATADLAISATAVGGLVAGVSATASISLDASAEVVGLIGSTVSATLAISADAELVAKGFLSAAGTIDLSANVELMGLGHMVVSTIDNTTLTADNIATAVWAAISADNNEPGTQGEKMNDAGSAANPWTEDLSGPQTAGTAGYLLKVATQILRNKQITNPNTGVMTVYDDDGTTVLFTANLFQDAAGSTAYQGQGAERRERLE